MDTGWIEEFKKSEEGYSIFYKNDNTSVDIISLHVKEGVVQKKQSKTHTLKKNNILSSIEIKKLISDDKPSGYRVISLLSFNVKADPEEVRQGSARHKLVTHNIIEDIIFEKTIEYMQGLNCIIIIYDHTGEVKQPPRADRGRTKRACARKGNKTTRKRLKGNTTISVR